MTVLLIGAVAFVLSFIISRLVFLKATTRLSKVVSFATSVFLMYIAIGSVMFTILGSYV